MSKSYRKLLSPMFALVLMASAGTTSAIDRAGREAGESRREPVSVGREAKESRRALVAVERRAYESRDIRHKSECNKLRDKGKYTRAVLAQEKYTRIA